MASVTRQGQKPNEATPLVEDDKGGDLLATIKVIGAGGAGIVADGYDLQVINLVIAIVARLHPDEMGPRAKSFSAAMTLVGVVCGQLSFGPLADVLGRKVASLMTAFLTIAGALLSACVVSTPGMSIATSLGICRFILGLGIGGEYPLSAAISQEAGGSRLCLTRPQLLVTNMLLFNVGFLIQAILVLAMVKGGTPLYLTWRIALACGVVPSLIAMALRMDLHAPEPQAEETSSPSRSSLSYSSQLRETLIEQWPALLGCCLNWFLFNFTAYGQGSFASIICDRLLRAPDDSVEQIVTRDAIFALMISLCCLAGSITSYPLESRLSRFTLQVYGFAGMAVSVGLCGGLFGHVPHSWDPALVVSYGSCVFHMALVGITTYLLPTEGFPASARGTCVGMAAASGKLGGVVGTALFPICEATYGLNTVLVFSGCVSLAGILVTCLLTPRGARSAESKCRLAEDTKLR